AVEAANSPMVHNALHKVVALHPVFVSGEVGVLEEVCDAGFQGFEMPVVGEPFARQETNRPVVVFSGDGALKGSALRVTLHADVVAAHKIESLRIDDVRFSWVLDMQAAGA